MPDGGEGGPYWPAGWNKRMEPGFGILKKNNINHNMEGWMDMFDMKVFSNLKKRYGRKDGLRRSRYVSIWVLKKNIYVYNIYIYIY